MVNNQKKNPSLRAEKFDREAIERTLCQIADIEAARIVSSQANLIDELHILASSNKGPKQIVRDIESTLIARYGLSVDHKKISIAQLGGNGGGVRKSWQRLRIGAVNTEVSNLETNVSVELLLDSERFIGNAKGITSQTGRLRLIGEATLEAVEKWTKADYRFSLEDVKMVKLGRQQAAVICISMISSGGEISFTGSALVKGTESETVVRATLAAVNRKVGI